MSSYHYANHMAIRDVYGYRVNNSYEERCYPSEPSYPNWSSSQPPIELESSIPDSNGSLEAMMLSLTKNLTQMLRKDNAEFLQEIGQELSQFGEEQSAWVQNMQGKIDELKTEVEWLKEQRLKTSSPHIWYYDEDDCPMIDPTIEMVEDVDQPNGEEMHPVLENLEDNVPKLELSHPEEVTRKPLEPKGVEVIVDMRVSEKEVIFPLDHYIMNWEVEAPNPVLLLLGRYFIKVPRAKARLILPEDEMDGSLTEYARKNHERKTIPFDNG